MLGKLLLGLSLSCTFSIHSSDYYIFKPNDRAKPITWRGPGMTANDKDYITTLLQFLCTHPKDNDSNARMADLPQHKHWLFRNASVLLLR